jgi:hypothetical protein
MICLSDLEPYSPREIGLQTRGGRYYVTAYPPTVIVSKQNNIEVSYKNKRLNFNNIDKLKKQLDKWKQQSQP